MEKKMRTIQKFLLSAAMLALASLPVAAQALLEDAFEMVEACRYDARRFCADVPPGGGRIALCLSLYRNELSPGCYKAVTLGTAIRACRNDYLRFCPGVLPGDGRVIDCLSVYADEVSTTCKGALKAVLAASGFNEYRGGYRSDGYRYEDRDRRYGHETYRRPYEQGDGRYDRDDDDDGEDSIK
jgi:hypothetical protein